MHPRAQLAAEASEAAAAQGAFWAMHDLLLQHQDALTMMDLRGYAESLGLDADRFGAELERHMYETRVAQDVESADRPGCPAPRRSSSMASAATVHSTSTHWWLRSRPPARSFERPRGNSPRISD